MYVNFNKDKRGKTMKYETPEMTVLTPAINAIQGVPKHPTIYFETPVVFYEIDGAYADWE
jgi:hypothetical protein